MSTLTQHTETVPRLVDLPLMRASRSYFLLGQDARGLWLSAQTPARTLVYACRAKRPCDSRDWKVR
jgi:hypothetical protein